MRGGCVASAAAALAQHARGGVLRVGVAELGRLDVAVARGEQLASLLAQPRRVGDAPDVAGGGGGVVPAQRGGAVARAAVAVLELLREVEHGVGVARRRRRSEERVGLLRGSAAHAAVDAAVAAKVASP